MPKYCWFMYNILFLLFCFSLPVALCLSCSRRDGSQQLILALKFSVVFIVLLHCLLTFNHPFPLYTKRSCHYFKQKKRSIIWSEVFQRKCNVNLECFGNWLPLSCLINHTFLVRLHRNVLSQPLGMINHLIKNTNIKNLK